MLSVACIENNEVCHTLFGLCNTSVFFYKKNLIYLINSILMSTIIFVDTLYTVFFTQHLPQHLWFNKFLFVYAPLMLQATDTKNYLISVNMTLMCNSHPPLFVFLLTNLFRILTIVYILEVLRTHVLSKSYASCITKTLVVLSIRNYYSTA